MGIDNKLCLLCRLTGIELLDPRREQKCCMVGPLLGGCVLAIPQQTEGL